MGGIDIGGTAVGGTASGGTVVGGVTVDGTAEASVEEAGTTVGVTGVASPPPPPHALNMEKEATTKQVLSEYLWCLDMRLDSVEYATRLSCGGGELYRRCSCGKALVNRLQGGFVNTESGTWTSNREALARTQRVPPKGGQVIDHRSADTADVPLTGCLARLTVIVIGCERA